MQPSLQSTIDLPRIKKLRSGKVREVFDLGETLLFVATDRLSAFDVILPDPIPHKGAVLNQLSAFWFKHFDKVDNHFVTAEYRSTPSKTPLLIGGVLIVIAELAYVWRERLRRRLAQARERARTSGLGRVVRKRLPQTQ